jgi:hypothetical protein
VYAIDECRRFLRGHPVTIGIPWCNRDLFVHHLVHFYRHILFTYRGTFPDRRL